MDSKRTSIHANSTKINELGSDVISRVDSASSNRTGTFKTHRASRKLNKLEQEHPQEYYQA